MCILCGFVCIVYFTRYTVKLLDSILTVLKVRSERSSHCVGSPQSVALTGPTLDIMC